MRYDIASPLFTFQLLGDIKSEEWNGVIDNKKCGLSETSLLQFFLPLIFVKTLKCGIIGLSCGNLDGYQPNYSLIAATYNLSFGRKAAQAWAAHV